ncbi:hypothetical protein FK531_00370 [Rhodococcus spelaei]|uniref:Uncharacterized protein n=1 Tax=Rhodococcus spelaei TaxID=2546320 RepID=A0A541BQM2_9NOCA|nr:hypothetical protein [Rhodococcus spelaei]TQF74604.1 hypothetical protein FK531_00370 [Rhodococcus spelaei]
MSNTDEYTEADAAEYEAKLNDIATDPTLSPDEKFDAASDALSEELEQIANSTGAPAATATATATAPEETTVTDPNQKLDDIDATLEDLGSIGADSAPADSGVVGDPETASYSTTTTTSATTSATTSVTTSAEGAPAEPAPAATATPDLNTAIGVDGNVDYYSPRDVDRDGNVDVIHSRVDGIDTITHVDDDGNITLVEQDTDHNGTYETAAAPRADGTIRVAEDLDDDGAVDLATFHDPATGRPVREDEIDGARITASQFDTDGDGQPDVHLVDSNGDGRFDTVALDTDGDGIVNATLVDTDGDGKFDLVTSDDDNDGSQETYLTAADNGVGSLGDISTFESLIPADDSYHTQSGANSYEPPAAHEVPGDLV